MKVLRAIRFSSRLFFRLDEELEEAARRPDVRAALSCKVSRERIYKECEGIFSSKARGGGVKQSSLRVLNAFSTMDRLGCP